MTELQAILLGLVQGLTEFLPVSSSGHLIITSALLRITSPFLETFEIVIQLGSILAVVVLYWPRFWGILFPIKGKRFSGIRGLYLLFLTCLPAGITGLLLHDIIKSYLFNTVSVALALAVGALFILFAERKNTCQGNMEKYRIASVDDITPGLALRIGMFQCLSLWPGFSRSTSTIMGGMLLGANRATAAEYSFLAAVPIMVAATGYSLLKDVSSLTQEALPIFAIGTAVSFLAALAAIKVFMKLISKMSFCPFAWYRLALAPIILWVF